MRRRSGKMLSSVCNTGIRPVGTGEKCCGCHSSGEDSIYLCPRCEVSEGEMSVYTSASSRLAVCHILGRWGAYGARARLRLLTDQPTTLLSHFLAFANHMRVSRTSTGRRACACVGANTMVVHDRSSPIIPPSSAPPPSAPLDHPNDRQLQSAHKRSTRTCSRSIPPALEGIWSTRADRSPGDADHPPRWYASRRTPTTLCDHCSYRAMR